MFVKGSLSFDLNGVKCTRKAEKTPRKVLTYKSSKHRLIKTQIGHARDFAWYRGQRPSPARVILSHERVQIHARENLCSYATNPPHFRVRELLLCDILITCAGDGRWPRYQAKSLACPGCASKSLRVASKSAKPVFLALFLQLMSVLRMRTELQKM